MRRGRLLLLCLCCPPLVSARIMPADYAVDLAPLLTGTHAILSGTVVSVSFSESQVRQAKAWPVASSARLRVDRWYRGSGSAELVIPYRTPSVMMGHDSINFQPGTHWLVFAIGSDDHFSMIDDCIGALRSSARLTPIQDGASMSAQLEADFTAGLDDPDPAGRIFSIQRLGGLKSPSSLPALYRVIDQGIPTERNWAIYSVLRTGDLSVLPRVVEILKSGQREIEAWAFLDGIRTLKNRAAIPALIEISGTAVDPRARSLAVGTLANFHAVEAVPAIAARLTDADANVQINAADGIQTITGESSCAKDVQRCRAWWENRGKRIYRAKSR